MDFTIKKYSALLGELLEQGYAFQTFGEFISSPMKKVVILRHDIDKKPRNALKLAQIENKLNIAANYMFRIVPQSNSVQVINEIVSLGHEIGYHYEDLVIASKKMPGIKFSSQKRANHDVYASAFRLFQENLEHFRRYYPLKVISMHGSPLSGIDCRELWKYYNYRALGIVCEPYFDIDYSSVLYLTDTGRSWNRGQFNIRDGAVNEQSVSEWKSYPIAGSLMNMTNEAIEFQGKFRFRSTNGIIKTAKNGLLPDQVIINTHPQRWTDSLLPWLMELVTQNLKNPLKYLLIRFR